MHHIGHISICPSAMMIHGLYTTQRIAIGCILDAGGPIQVQWNFRLARDIALSACLSPYCDTKERDSLSGR